MRAVCLVAHPDDCVIFAWPFIEAHPEFAWHNIYLTYRDWDPRAQEARHFWAAKNISCTFLGYRDDYESVKRGELGFDGTQAERELSKITEGCDLILTHYEDGDYGHLHHKFVNSVANKTATAKVYFASTFNYNTKYQVQNPVNTELWPIHQEVIEGFQDRNTGLYIVTEEAKKII